MPDLVGEGDCATVSILPSSAIKLTCFILFALFDCGIRLGVVGIGGRALSTFGLLGLLASDGIAVDFLRLALGWRRIDLTLSNLPGVRKVPLGSDLGILRPLVVAGFGRVRGVPNKLRLAGDFDRLGI